jgi:hypothetical protein
MSAVVAGIDEAGLGPLLGPLTLGWNVLEVPDAASDPWSLLDGAVAREPRLDAKRFVVADSKKVYTRNVRGRRRLEATALAFLGLARNDRTPPGSPRDLLLGAVGPDVELLARHPWYARLPDALPLHWERGALELRAARLDRATRAAGLTVLGAGVRTVPAGELNRSFDATGSKAETLWHVTSELLAHVWRRFGERAPVVTVDRQGGRTHYGPSLARAFPEAAVRLLHETPEDSAYELVERSGGARRMRVAFRPKGDVSSFPVALASCLAKYARELVMGAFNAYFGGLQEGLRPTAGYTTDGRRWMADAAPALDRAGLDRRLLVRER